MNNTPQALVMQTPQRHHQYKISSHPKYQNTASTLNNTINRQKNQKLSLASNIQQQNSDNFYPELMLKAFNNSYTQRMSGHFQQLNTKDIVNGILQLAMTNLSQNQKSQDISKRKWCIVQVDEHFLKNKLLDRGILFCNTHISNQERNQYNIANNIQLPSTIRPYCLVLNMNEKQLHFQSHEEGSNHFFINLDTVCVQIQQQQKINQQLLLKDQKLLRNWLNKPICLKILDKNHPLQIRMYLTQFTLPFPFKQTAPNEQKLKYLLTCRQALYQILHKSIKQSRGSQFKLRQAIHRSVQNSTLYYNARYATEQQFAKYCESGDLLLFKDNHTFAKLQRAITHSPYDHVAIVYKSDQYGLCIFQSNSNLGVGLANWRRLIKNEWYTGIQQISWRKLQVHNKPSNFQQIFDKFVKQNVNKKFGLNLGKLLKFRSKPQSDNVSNDKSYFCSELVAQLYKKLGLLDTFKSGSQYWPRDFADGNGIQIINGALDAQRQLIFQKSILKQCYPGF